MAIVENMNLSRHFTLFEMCNVKKYGRYNEPGENEIVNLKQLCSFLEMLRDRLGGLSIIVNSGYRNKNVNLHVGGVPTSDHVKGLAADIRVIGYTPIRLAEFIRSNDFLNGFVGQVIIYPTFVHVSINRFKHRSQYLIKKGSRYVSY